MTDQAKQKEEKVEEASDDVVESEDTVVAQEEKPKFTQKQQDEVNRLLAQERKKAENKSRQSLEKAQTEWSTTEQLLRSQIAEFESGIEAVIKVQTADFPPAVLKLLAKEPVLEQWRLLQDPEFVTEVRKQNVTPKTPQSDGKHTARPTRQVPLGGR